MSRKQISDQELLVEIDRLYNDLGEPPSSSEMREKGKYSLSPYQSRFGSWNSAIKEAGYSPKERYRISSDELITSLRKLYREIGETPSAEQMTRAGKHSQSAFTRRFGSWNSALREAGLPVNKEEEFSYEELRDQFQKATSELGDTPTQEEMRALGYSTGPFKRKFGSWNEAISTYGHEPNSQRNIDKQNLLDEIQRLAEDLGRPPSASEMDELGEYAAATYSNRFKSWTRAVEKAGFEAYLDRRVRESEGVPYGPNWREMRNQTRERDDFQCQGCGVSEDRHKEDLGQQLHVHHRTPRREFVEDGVLNYEESNRLENLVTVCAACHRLAETRPNWP